MVLFFSLLGAHLVNPFGRIAQHSILIYLILVHVSYKAAMACIKDSLKLARGTQVLHAAERWVVMCQSLHTDYITEVLIGQLNLVASYLTSEVCCYN